MNQWFEKPGDVKPWTYDPSVFEPAARRRRETGRAVAVGFVATIFVFLAGMAVTNREHIPRFYPTCEWARLVGAAPIPSGTNGYRQELDSDSDGLACEPYQDL